MENSQNIPSKNKILDIAFELFAANGFAATSIRQIAAKAEVNLAMIGYYFGGKEGLYRAVVNSRISEFNESILQEIKSEKNIKKRVEIFSHKLMNSLISTPSILTIITRELVSDNPIASYFTDELVNNFRIIYDSFFDGTVLAGKLGRPGSSDAYDIVYNVFMLLAPVYFYSIVRPIIDNNILIDETEIEKFRSKLNQYLVAYADRMLEKLNA
ncbi:MAG: hypothetical protein A2096_12605 [Spirochaetes bacterium GWF1_41_5]|nr:MAG: hypothetical protein A2096_12605 [Spirochaetes bacterium GWF1_41_5]HBE00997.1 hypothetical protein [Spirochaetia bacterium]